MIKTGEIRIIENNDEIAWTVLGSCISVVFFTGLNLSLINHAQMPSRSKFDKVCSDNCPHPCFNVLPDTHDFKYVNCSLEYMINVLKQKRINLQSIRTTLIGGSSVLNIDTAGKTIGEQNIEVAREILSKNRIAINRELIGQREGITFWFNPANNEIRYRKHSEEKKRIL
jgi:chemotaxis receptor (MCP) glutamine deamidase CheD